MCLDPIDPAAVREEQQIGMRRGCEQVLDDVALFEVRTLHPATTAALLAVGIERHALDVAVA